MVYSYCPMCSVVVLCCISCVTSVCLVVWFEVAGGITSKITLHTGYIYLVVYCCFN